jgi:hypothetical protein
MDPFKLLKEAIEAVPAVRYALGVAGIAAIVAIIIGLKLNPQIAVFGTLIVLGLMFVLLVFSKYAGKPDIDAAGPASLLVWFYALAVIVATVLFMTSYFANWPVQFRPKFPGQTSTTVIDFASEDTNRPPQHVRAADYLRQFGIGISDVADDSNVVLQHDFATTGGSAFSSPSHNVLTQIDCHGEPVGFTLRFDKPLSRISFKRASLIAGHPNGVTHPAWSACSYNEAKKLSCKGEQLIRVFDSIPEGEFFLDGPGITSVRFESDLRLNGKPFTAFCGVLVQSVTLTP